jgi:hypothetical protein
MLQEMSKNQHEEWLLVKGTGSTVIVEDGGILKSITDPRMPLLDQEVVCNRI